MNTIGSHPGAILFRLSIMVVLIAIMMAVFFSYIEGTEKELEKASVLQTKSVIDSSLALLFANYAVSGDLHKLGEVDGGNPFEILRKIEILPSSYRGEIDGELDIGDNPGWYYLKSSGRVVYKSHFIGTDRYFRIRLGYQDSNGSGLFEYGVDRFQNLTFVEIGP